MKRIKLPQIDIVTFPSVQKHNEYGNIVGVYIDGTLSTYGPEIGGSDDRIDKAYIQGMIEAVQHMSYMKHYQDIDYNTCETQYWTCDSLQLCREAAHCWEKDDNDRLKAPYFYFNDYEPGNLVEVSE